MLKVEFREDGGVSEVRSTLADLQIANEKFADDLVIEVYVCVYICKITKVTLFCYLTAVFAKYGNK